MMTLGLPGGKGAAPAGALDLLKHLAASRWNYIKASFGSRGEDD